MCHVAKEERATSCSVRQVEARVTLKFRSAAVEGYWTRLVVGPRFTRLGHKCLGCRLVRLDRGSGLGLVQLNYDF